MNEGPRKQFEFEVLGEAKRPGARGGEKDAPMFGKWNTYTVADKKRMEAFKGKGTGECQKEGR